MVKKTFCFKIDVFLLRPGYIKHTVSSNNSVTNTRLQVGKAKESFHPPHSKNVKEILMKMNNICFRVNGLSSNQDNKKGAPLCKKLILQSP